MNLSKKIFVVFALVWLFTSCAVNSKNTENQTTNSSWTISTWTENNQKQEKLYLDVREDDEWEAGHVKWAMHIKLSEILAGNYSEIPKDETVYVYCRSWRRASEAIKYLEEKWFKNLVNVWWLSWLRDVEIVTWK